jgi:uncharacterized membrane protein YbhN (UPF0104 family)
LRVGGALATALICIIAFHRVDTRALKNALSGASLWQIAAAMAVSLGLQTMARVRRTMVILRTVPGRNIGFGDLFSLLLGGYAAGYLIPGPSEEILHTAGLTRFGFRLGDLMSVQLTEKSLSVLSMALMALPVLPIEGNSRLVVGFAAAAALGALVIHRIKSDRAIPLDRLLEALWWVLVSNLSSVAMMWLCFSSVGAHPAFSTCLRIFAVTACACALPLTPGQVGVLESAFVVMATHLGVAADTALAAGILYHVAHVVPVVAGGLPAMMRLRGIIERHTSAGTWRVETCADQS